LEPGAAEKLQTGSAYVDIRGDRFTAQAWQVIRNLEATLAGADSSLRHLVLLRVVFRRREDVPTWLRIAKACLGPWLPACDLVIGASSGASADIDLVVDGIATSHDGPRPEVVVLPGLAHLLAPFPTAVRAHPFLYSSTLPGFEATSRESLRTASRLGEDDRGLVEALKPADAEVENFFVDQATMWRNLRHVLASCEMSLSNVVYHGSWLTRSMDYLAFGSVPRLLTAELSEFCLTCFPVPGLAYPGTQWSGRVVALLPEASDQRSVRTDPHPLSRAYYGMVRVGHLLLSSGEVPIDVPKRLLVDRPDRLALAHRGLATGQPQHDSSTATQVRHIFGLIEKGLRSHGLDFGAVAHQTLYLTSLADFPAAMLVASHVYGGRLPATSVIPVLGATAFDGCRAEIEVIASIA
jgi:enamine deaminase RidA (YjgF/YER057c/UK114 family)